jgi:hypothetical protein
MNSSDQIKAQQDVGAILTIGEMQEVCEALNACDEFLEGREDVVDGPDGSPRPNKAMQLRMVVHEAMSAMDAAMNRVEP